MSIAQYVQTITWSQPILVEELRYQRHLIPSSPGVYVFTCHDGPIAAGPGVWYVGRAVRKLSGRLPSYLVDPAVMQLMSSRSGTPRLNTSLRHAGKVGLLVKLQQRCRGGAPSNVFVRWHVTPDAAKMEAILIPYLDPAFNTLLKPAD